MKMDDIDLTNKHYQKISTTAVSILIVVLQAYLMLILSGIDLFNFSMVQNDVARYIIQILVQLVLFSIIYSFIYAATKKVYTIHWIKTHKSCWIQGVWLHIHIKSDLRIGTVEIEQDFNTIKAKGYNETPKGAMPEKGATTWTYILSSVFDDKSARDFVGCYTAVMENSVSKDGIHMLHILNTDRVTGYPSQMRGWFRDTYCVDDSKVSDIDGHKGQLLFFKLSNKCSKYLYDENGFRYDLLASLHEREEFQDEPYVIKLKECLKALNISKDAIPQ